MTARDNTAQAPWATAPKFLFDRDFEAPLETEGGLTPEPAAEAEPAGETAPLASPLRFSETELQQASEAAREAGRAAGQAEALAGIEEATARSLAAIDAGLARLAADAADGQAQRRAEALQLAVTVLRKLFPALAEQDGLAEVIKVVGDCLDLARDEPRLVVRVSDGLLDRIQELIGPLTERTGFEGKLVLLAENTLGPSDVRVEWANGGSERNVEKQWRRIDALLHRALSSAGASTAGDSQSGTPPDIFEEHADER